MSIFLEFKLSEGDEAGDLESNIPRAGDHTMHGEATATSQARRVLICLFILSKIESHALGEMDLVQLRSRSAGGVDYLMKHLKQGVDGICSINVGWISWMHLGEVRSGFTWTRGMARWIVGVLLLRDDDLSNRVCWFGISVQNSGLYQSTYTRYPSIPPFEGKDIRVALLVRLERWMPLTCFLTSTYRTILRLSIAQSMTMMTSYMSYSCHKSPNTAGFHATGFFATCRL